MLDGVKAKREPLACRPLVGIGGPIIGDVILAEESKLLVGRGERTGSRGGEACFETGLDFLAGVGAHVRHGLARAAQDVLGLQRHRAQPGTVARIVGHVVGDHALGLTVNGHLHVGADLGATALPKLHGTAFCIREGELGAPRAANGAGKPA